jgi:hypothetical protein
MTDQAEYTYDLFISYAEADRAWVEGYLLDALIQAGVRCHSEAAFALGVPRLLEFERAVYKNQRTLIVLPPASLADHMARLRERAGTDNRRPGRNVSSAADSDRAARKKQLPVRLSMLTTLDLSHPRHSKREFERLVWALQGPLPRR